MKLDLINKKTGEIGYLIVGKGSNHYVVTNNLWESCGEYNSLAELNEEWEDYEEPKEGYTFHPATHKIVHIYEQGKCRLYTDEDISHLEEVGMWFETEAEAKKAVEKLKAWKRLRDKGFEFKYIENNHIEFDSGYIDDVDRFTNDMALLFGGEE